MNIKNVQAIATYSIKWVNIEQSTGHYYNIFVNLCKI